MIISNGTEASVIEGFNSIHLNNTTLSGGVAKTGGIMVYQSMSGDAVAGTWSVTGNSALTGPSGIPGSPSPPSSETGSPSPMSGTPRK